MEAILEFIGGIIKFGLIGFTFIMIVLIIIGGIEYGGSKKDYL